MTLKRVMPPMGTMEERIAAFCEWFGVEPPRVEYDEEEGPAGGPLLNDDLWNWFMASGASFDWIICGDPRPMAGAYRRDVAQEHRLLNVLAKFDDEEQRLLAEALSQHEDGAPIEAALEGWRVAVEAHRCATG